MSEVASERCAKCGSDIAPQYRFCDVCSADVGFPNVRHAQRPGERAALEERLRGAYASANARSIRSEFTDFHKAMGSTVAVMNRNISVLSGWVNGPSPLFMSFHKQLSVLGRHPAPNEWDEGRAGAESVVNPYSYLELNFAALSLDGLGMPYYGDYAVTLRSVTIEDRTSVFEENPFIFNQKHHLYGGKTAPLGYRASWADRADLASAKLQPRIVAGMTRSDFASVLIEQRRAESDCDFVEVHIYGDVNRQGIERVVGPEPQERADRVLWKQARRKLESLGASVETAA